MYEGGKKEKRAGTCVREKRRRREQADVRGRKEREESRHMYEGGKKGKRAGTCMREERKRREQAHV